MTTTFRQDVVRGLLTIVNGVKTAHPQWLPAVHPARPAAFNATPCCFVGSRDETVAHTGGVRQRVMEATVVLVTSITDNAQNAAIRDALIDELMDALTANPQVIPGMLIEQTRVETSEIDSGGVPYAADVITCSASIQEPRIP